MATPSIETSWQSLIDAILREQLRLEPSQFTTERLTIAKNNHVYRVDLAQAFDGSALHGTGDTRKALTHPVPTGTTKLIVRIPMASSSLNDSVRIRNEVAFLTLGYQALPELVPQVYDWSDSDPKASYILEEYKDGVVLSKEEFAALDDDRKSGVLKQVAQIVKSLQGCKLSDGLAHGGLTFNDQGVLSSTASVIPCDGPFDTYQAALKGMCLWQLRAADRSSQLDGWRSVPFLRERLDKFLGEGLDRVLGVVEDQRPVVIHGDLSLPNLLFEPETYRITAILDFDFAHLAHPISEYLFSFIDFDGFLAGSIDSTEYRDLVLRGASADEEDEKFRLAALFDHALQAAGAQRVSDIPGAAQTSDIWWFSQELCQPFWHMDRWLAARSQEDMDKQKLSCAGILEKHLAGWKY